MSGGRPTDLTPELGAKLCELVRAGLPVCKAAEHEGIHPETVRRWSKRTEPIYAAFSGALKKARGESQKQSIEKIRSGAPGWQGEAWYLERSDPKNWGRRLETTITKKPKGEPIQPSDDRPTVIAKLKAALADQEEKLARETH